MPGKHLQWKTFIRRLCHRAVGCVIPKVQLGLAEKSEPFLNSELSSSPVLDADSSGSRDYVSFPESDRLKVEQGAVKN
jgi:hypothetical protein